MIRDPEIREAAERLAAEWARSINTLATAAEVHAIEFALDRMADPSPENEPALNMLLAKRIERRAAEISGVAREVSRATRELSEY